MALIDFKEIPSSQGGKEGQDLWALFAREFFEALHLKIEEGPDRGPDSGRDLIVTENRQGSLGVTQHRWLVSCKHYAHSKKAVPNKDEIDILGRVRKFNANGFMGFYSTVPSAELARTLEKTKPEIEVELFDNEKIERHLLEKPELKQIFERFFPKSYKLFHEKYKLPKAINDSKLKIKCSVCGKDLSNEDGIVAFGNNRNNNKNESEILDMYWACRGECDRILEKAYQARGMWTSWEEFSDLSIPLIFMHWVITTMNSIRNDNHKFSDAAYEKFTEFTFAMAQRVVRETSREERERIETLRDIPDFVGGLSGWGTKVKYFHS